MVNLVGKVPPLEASGAAVTLVHPTATTVVGQWDVTYPQDMPEEQRPNLGPTRTFGYAHRLVSKPPRFARRHVRRDVQIDARDTNGWSNAEAQMDSAARELSGDVVFQRTLTGDDLGALVPNVDFKQGDVLPLMVWGMIVPATCTSIRYTLDDGRRTVEVGFGPSLTADRDGLAESMSQIDRQMRAEAAGIDEYLAKQLDEAKAASDQQMNGLKTYVDEQDNASKEHADLAASNALDSAKADATTKADKALKAAERYSDQGIETLTDNIVESVLPQFDLVYNTIGEVEDTARQNLDDYRTEVNGLIGEQGTITQDLADLNRDYTEKLGANGTVLADLRDINTKYTNLSNDFTAKVGENGTLVNDIKTVSNDLTDLSRDFTNKVGENGTLVQDQRATSNLIDAMVHGKPHRELTGSEFQAHQQSVNKMQSAFNRKQVDINTGFQGLFDAQAVTNAMQAEFNRKQVGINTGFQNLFKAQDDINKVNSAFQKKQYDLNTGFQRLFEAQAYTNSLQLAFNKKQVGINNVYDAMWEEQNQRDLAQEYLIEYNKITAEAGLPHHVYFEVVRGKEYTDASSPYLAGMDWASNYVAVGIKEGVAPVLMRYEVDFRKTLDSGYTTKHATGIVYPSLITKYGRGHRISFPEDTGAALVQLLFFPTKIVPFYQEKLDALAKDYRAKGLKV